MLPEFITAINDRLRGDVPLTDVVPAPRIGNHILDDATFPHIDWALTDVADGQVKQEESYAGELQIDVFSDYNGDLEVLQIHQLIYDALQRQPLTVVGADNAYMSFQSISLSTEDDNRTRQATILYTFMIGEN